MAVGVAVLVEVYVNVDVIVFVLVAVGVAVLVEVGVEVTVIVEVAVRVAVGVAVLVYVLVGVKVLVDVTVGVGVNVPQKTSSMVSFESMGIMGSLPSIAATFVFMGQVVTSPHHVYEPPSLYILPRFHLIIFEAIVAVPECPRCDMPAGMVSYSVVLAETLGFSIMKLL